MFVPSLRDVLILGGGPAGCATAIELRRRGLAVSLLNASRPNRGPRIETLPPEVMRYLAGLDFWDEFRQAGIPPCPGIVSLWGASEPVETDYLFNPWGHGWHASRERLASWLREAAVVTGCCVLTGEISDARRDGDRWNVAIQLAPGQPYVLQPRFVVDASGRRAVWARRCAVARHRADRQVAVVGCFASAPDDTRLWIEATESGWWYSSPAADALLMAFVSEGTIVRDLCLTDCRRWLTEARRTTLHKQRLPATNVPVSLLTIDAGMSCLSSPVGEAWLAVGDAALTVDPLSGQGVCQAIGTANQAATTIVSALNGDHRACRRYAEALVELHRDSLIHRVNQYQQEQRWPNAEYWNLRHSQF
jgi:2-polyprenyl-6-methoxyphenol hydroxylase-like FAD-dependent oxidoreductase